MSYEFFIAKRYLWSKRHHPFVGVVNVVSVLGICVGVAALITVLAVMNGFDEDLKSRIIGMRAHVVVEKEGALDEAPAVLEKIKNMEAVAAVSSYVEGQALVQAGDFASGVIVRGVDTEKEKQVSHFYQSIEKGTLSETDNGVVVGSELAHRAGLSIGSPISIATQETSKPMRGIVEGIFSSGMYDYDANLVFLNLKNAQRIFALGNKVSGISVYLKKAELADSVKAAIHHALGYPYSVRTWMDLNRTFFSALKLEKMTMFLILALIILVASLNIAGSLTILVMDKTKDIGTLKALGATPLDLMKIFVWDGLILGFAGSAAGSLLGVGLCAFLQRFPLIELPKEIYYIDRLPVKINAADTGWVILVAMALSLLSAFYPALMAGRLDPVKALRYE